MAMENSSAPPPTDPVAAPPVIDVWKRVAMYGAFGGVAGAAGGGVLATYRGHSVPFYAASMGTNYAIASFAFYSTEALIRRARGEKRDALGYAGAGGVTGLVMTLPIGGRFQAIVASIALAGVGYGGFYAHRRARSYLDGLGQKRLAERIELQRREAGYGGQGQAYNDPDRVFDSTNGVTDPPPIHFKEGFGPRR